MATLTHLLVAYSAQQDMQFDTFKSQLLSVGTVQFVLSWPKRDQNARALLANHNILTEAGRCSIGAPFIALPHHSGPGAPLQLSGDVVQLRGGTADLPEDCFSEYTQYSLLEDFIHHGLPAKILTEQQQIIEPLAGIISKHWYRSKMTTRIETTARPNAPRAQAVIARFTNGKIKQRFGWIDLNWNRFATVRRNETQEGGIEPKDILLVTPFEPQHGALDRAVSRDDRLASVEAATIDGFLDGERSIVAPNFTTTGEMGFMTNNTHLLVA
ncbi:MAG: hypothetical protein Q9188_000945 [Gyalolechia gomerana]